MNNAVPKSRNSIHEAREARFLSFIAFYAQTIHQFSAAYEVSSLRFSCKVSGVRIFYCNSKNKMKISWFRIWITHFKLHLQDRMRFSYLLLQSIFSRPNSFFCIRKYSCVDSGNVYNFTGNMYFTHKVKIIFNKFLCEVTLCQWAIISRRLEKP
jgi:hypothetical protein